MPSLKNKKHERFARLVAQGMNQTTACAQVLPDRKFPERAAHDMIRAYGVRERISEIRELVDSQFAMMIGEKRDVLRRMALGEIPTKVIKKANGKLEAVFDRLGAIITDAKLAGEFAAEKVQMDIGPSIRLDFNPASRNTALTPALNAEFQMIEAGDQVEPEPIEIQEMPEGANLEGIEAEYDNIEIEENSDHDLATIANNNIFVDPSEDKPLQMRGLRSP
jgi:hypothetical protein